MSSFWKSRHFLQKKKCVSLWNGIIQKVRSSAFQWCQYRSYKYDWNTEGLFRYFWFWGCLGLQRYPLALIKVCQSLSLISFFFFLNNIRGFQTCHFLSERVIDFPTPIFRIFETVRLKKSSFSAFQWREKQAFSFWVEKYSGGSDYGSV